MTINHCFDICDAKVKIHHIKVPKYIENGTHESIVLDCEYTLDPNEDPGLVVKWFFREDPEPIYQWIYELDSRHVPQRYQNWVNPNFRQINLTEPWQQYRSLNLIRPTVEMTGRYSCHVIALTSEAHDADTMIVYAKTKSIDLITRRVLRHRNVAAFKSNDSRNNQYGNGMSSLPNGWSIYSHYNNNNSHTNNNGRTSGYTSNTGTIMKIGNNIQSNRQQQSDYPYNNKNDRHQFQQQQRPFDSNTNQGWYGSAASLSTSKKPIQSINTRQRLHQQYESKLPKGQNNNNNDDDNLVTVTEIECTVENVYPLPELTIYQVLGDGQTNTHRPRSLERARVQQNSTQLPNGAFRVSMIVSIDDEDLLMKPTSGTDNNNNNLNDRPMAQPMMSSSSSNDGHSYHSYYHPTISTTTTNSKQHHSKVILPTTTSSSTNMMAAKPTMFECLVAQDELKHELRKSTVFVPNIAQSWLENGENNRNSNSKTIHSMQSFTLIMAIILITEIIMMNMIQHSYNSL